MILFFFILVCNYYSIIYTFTAEYIDALIEKTKQLCKDGGTRSQTQSSDIPKPLSSQYEKPEKAVAIKSHKSRFNLPSTSSS